MGLFSKWRERRAKKRDERHNRRLERMNIRSERVKTRQDGGGFLGKLGGTVSQVLGNLGDPQDNSPVTGSGGSKNETIIVNDGQMEGMKKYLPFILGGLVLFFVMKKGR